MKTVGAVEPPLILLVNNIVLSAISRGARVIHLTTLKTGDDKLRLVAFEKYANGLFVEAQQLPRRLQSSIVTRLKLVSNCRISEHRVIQVGEFGLKNNSIRIEARKRNFTLIAVPTVSGPDNPHGTEEIVIVVPPKR